MRDWKGNGDSLQYDLLLDIGTKLREYSLPTLNMQTESVVTRIVDAPLLEVSRLDALETPFPRLLDFLREWLIRPAMGNAF